MPVFVVPPRKEPPVSEYVAKPLHRRLLSLMAGLAVVPVALTGCGVGSDAGADATAMAGSCELSETVTNDEPLTGEPSGEITFQTTALKESFSPYFEDLIAAFEEKYPDVTVKWQDDPGDATFTQRLVTDAQAC
jgi:multiple sugar transport system substrate-binding protein